MNPGDIVTPSPDHGMRTGAVYLYENISLKGDSLIPFNHGEIGTVLEVSFTFEKYNTGTEDIVDWIPVCKLLSPLGIGWIAKSYVKVV